MNLTKKLFFAMACVAALAGTTGCTATSGHEPRQTDHDSATQSHTRATYDELEIMSDSASSPSDYRLVSTIKELGSPLQPNHHLRNRGYVALLPYGNECVVALSEVTHVSVTSPTHIDVEMLSRHGTWLDMSLPAVSFDKLDSVIQQFSHDCLV